MRALNKKTRFWGRTIYHPPGSSTSTRLCACCMRLARMCPRRSLKREYYLDGVHWGSGIAAAPLQTVTLREEEVQPLFERLMKNIELMLAHQRVHADLSAIMSCIGRDEVTIIDFPQVVDPISNPLGFELLRRVSSICQYFPQVRAIPGFGELGETTLEAACQPEIT